MRYSLKIDPSAASGRRRSSGWAREEIYETLGVSAEIRLVEPVSLRPYEAMMGQVIDRRGEYR